MNQKVKPKNNAGNAQMNEALDVILSDEKITWREAMVILRAPFKSLSNTQKNEIREDLVHVFTDCRRIPC